jgi:hypothetical protein
MKSPWRHLSITWVNTSISFHMRSKGRKGKVGSWKVESPDELQEELIKGGRGTSLGGVCRQARERLWDSLPKCLRVRKRIQNPPDNNAKMLLHKL